MNCELQDKIFKAGEHDFEAVALDVFRFQFEHNPVYRAFASALGAEQRKVNGISSLPFLPVGLFRHHQVVSGTFIPELVFESSGTTGSVVSKHSVRSAAHYRESFLRCFRRFYDDPGGWCIAGLLPSYLERQHSSLVYMVNELIRCSEHPDSGFFLNEHRRLAGLLEANEASQQKTLLIGVTFALLDLAQDFATPLRHTVVMETGGMKGRRKEITREEVHAILKGAWSLDAIHSEYGMTELLSQAYSRGEGVFRCPPWMRVVLRDESDPLSVIPAPPQGGTSVTGLVNVIDLANIYSCAFIATDDIGRLHHDGSFEILGRADTGDVRGCSLMYA